MKGEIISKIKYNELKFKRKFCLKRFDEKTIKSILSKEDNYIVRDIGELKNYVIEALFDNKSNKNLHLGIVPNETIMRIKKNITDIKSDKINTLFKENIEYALVINQKEIRHMKKDSLSVDDVIAFTCLLDEIIVNFDTVRYTLYNDNQNALRFRKKITGNTIIVLEVISNKNHTVRTHTIFYDISEFKNKKKETYSQCLMNYKIP